VFTVEATNFSKESFDLIHRHIRKTLEKTNQGNDKIEIHTLIKGTD
jgi:hypothetical protein